MFQVSKLSHLKILNLSHNSIVSMSLASNHVRGVEPLNQNVHLEHLDLSENEIPAIVDMSYLKNLAVRRKKMLIMQIMQFLRS